ncbi:MAG: hypothetical protein HY692_07555 [Cyanobacteria bacterium NC_groundwater_1444_Ag_S-0.65um_54_12]|nr:hypothetical protein [Cyanobacteria bacterium NC_groundwater_1444_Ag_S-0.65um_54_12]
MFKLSRSIAVACAGLLFAGCKAVPSNMPLSKSIIAPGSANIDLPRTTLAPWQSADSSSEISKEEERTVGTMIEQGLKKDAADGFLLVPDTKKSYQVQFTSSPTKVVEINRFDGLWGYYLEEEAGKRYSFLHTNTRATQSTGSFYVPDASIVRQARAIVEASLSVPAGLPSGTLAQRIGVEMLADPVPLRGKLVIDRYYVPGSNGTRDSELYQLQISRELRFATPNVPAINGQAMVIKRQLGRFIPIPTGFTETQAHYLTTFHEDLPRTVDEHQVWPDGTVLQQITVVTDDLKNLYAKGNFIFNDQNRTPLHFDRQVNLATGTSVTVIRTLDGIVLVVAYDSKGIFTSGQVRNPDGVVIGTIKPIGPSTIQITYVNGIVQVISL